MTRQATMLRFLVLLLLGILVGGIVPTALAADDGPSLTYTLRGRLTYPDSGKPLQNATVRFTGQTPGSAPVEVQTDAQGEFVASGMGSDSFSISITTPEGDEIKGINYIKPSEETLEILFKISDRVESDTVVNLPAGFVVGIEVHPPRWKRFWSQFGIFFGAALAAGALVL